MILKEQGRFTIDLVYVKSLGVILRGKIFKSKFLYAIFSLKDKEKWNSYIRLYRLKHDVMNFPRRTKEHNGRCALIIP